MTLPEIVTRYYIKWPDGSLHPGWYEYYADAEDRAQAVPGAVVLECDYRLTHVEEIR